MDKLVKWLENLLRAQKKSRAWRTFVSCLAAIVVFTTTYSLILPAITVEQSATEDVGGLVLDEADPGSTGAEAEVSGEVVTVDADNETTGETSDENPDEVVQEEAPAAEEEAAQTAPTEETPSENKTTQSAASQTETTQTSESKAAVAEEVREPVNGEVQTIGDKRVMTLKGDDFDVVVSGDLSVGVSDRTVLSVRGIADADVVKSFSDRISDELLKIFVDKKTTEVLYQLVFTDENLVEYAPAGYFDVQFIFHRNTVSHTGEKIYAAIYDYLTDEMVLAEKNGDEYETPVISLDEYGIIKGITLKGMHFDEYSDIITLVAGPVNEELKLVAEKAADSKTESTGEKTDSIESKPEGPTAKAETSKGSETAGSGTLTARGSDYTVTLTYSADAKIPANAKLEVSEIENGTRAYKKYLKQAKAAMGLDEDQELPKEQARFFDIKIMADGKEVQPTANVSVNITYDQPVVEADFNTEAQIDASAVHFGKDGAEVVEVADVDANRVEFEAESFSVYGVIYTVDFEYTDPATGDTYYYRLNGNESINLTELLVLLGIKTEENVEEFVANHVENVEFSDPALVKITHNGKILGLFGKEDWKLESLQPFDTEETLTISLENGEIIVVKVTDAQTSNNLGDYMTNAVIVAPTNSEGKYVVEPNMDYTIKLTFAETNDLQFPNSGTMTYTLPEGLTCANGSSGQISIKVKRGNETYEVKGNEYSIQNGVLTFHFNESDPNFPQLTASASARFTLNFEGQFREDATEISFTDDIKKDVVVDLSNSVSATKVGQVNYQDGKIWYTVNVQSKGASTNVKVTDTITGTGLSLDPDSFELTSTTGTTVSGTKTVNGNTFEYTIPSMKSGEIITFKYAAKIDPTAIPLQNGKVITQANNSVKVVSDGDPDNEPVNTQNTIDYTPGIQKEVVGKENKEGDVTTVTWKITANPNPVVSMAGGTVTDKIQDNSKSIMKYSGDGLRIVVKDANGRVVRDNQDNPVTWASLGVDITTADTWNYTIPAEDAGNAYSYEIYYTTDVNTSKNSGMFQVHNHSETDGEKTADAHADVIGTGTPGPGPSAPTLKKEVSKVDLENKEVTWNVTFEVPKEGLETAVVTDFYPGTWISDGKPHVDPENEYNIQYGYWLYENVINGSVVVTGINTEAGEHYQVEYFDSPNNIQNKPGKAVITFYKNNQNEPGLNGGSSARIISVTLKTVIDDLWLQKSITDPNNGGKDHVNNVEFNGKTATATASIVGGDFKKTAKYYGSRDDGNGNELPIYQYELLLTGVHSTDMTITDTFDTSILEPYVPTVTNYTGKVFTDWSTNPFVLLGGSIDYQGNRKLSTTEVDHNNNPAPVPVSYLSTSDGIEIITSEDNVPMDGNAFYNAYRLTYYLTVKDEAALQEIMRRAGETEDGKYVISNHAEWEGRPGTGDVTYEYKGLTKEILTSDSELSKTNEDIFADFRITLNPGAAMLNGGDPISVTDEFENLSIIYTSIVASPSEGVSYDFVGNTVTFTIPDETKVVITYRARVVFASIGEDGETVDVPFSNVVRMKGYQAEIEKDAHRKHDGEGDADIPIISLMKYAAGDMTNRLQGAEFALLDSNKQPITWGKDYTEDNGSEHKQGDPVVFVTDENGLIEVVGDEENYGWHLDFNKKYYLKETKAPEGFMLLDYVTEFTISEDGTTDYDNRIYHSGDIMSAKNYPGTDVSVEKKWLDEQSNDVADQHTADKVTVKLQQRKRIGDDNWSDWDDTIRIEVKNSETNTYEWQDVSGKTVTLQKSNEWKDVFNSLPLKVPADITDPDGDDVDVEYQIVETEINGKTLQEAGVIRHEIVKDGTRYSYTVKNIVRPATGSLKITKVVKVNDNPPADDAEKSLVDGKYVFKVDSGAGITPSITRYVEITVEGGVATSYKVANSNEALETATSVTAGTAVVGELPEGDYTITETGKNGLKLKGIVRGDSNTSVVDLNNDKVTVHVTAGVDNPETTTAAVAEFTNNIEAVKAKVVKVWNDNGNSNRPPTLKVTLSNGTEVTLPKDGQWEATITGLPKYDSDGQEIEYSWTEEELPSGYYLASYDETKDETTGVITTTLTNAISDHYNPLTSIKGKKIWDDGGREDRPDSITVILKNGDDVVARTTVNKPTAEGADQDQWPFEFTNLPVFNEDGSIIQYTVEEVLPEGYSSVYGVKVEFEQATYIAGEVTGAIINAYSQDVNLCSGTDLGYIVIRHGQDFVVWTPRPMQTGELDKIKTKVKALSDQFNGIDNPSSINIISGVPSTINVGKKPTATVGMQNGTVRVHFEKANSQSDIAYGTIPYTYTPAGGEGGGTITNTSKLTDFEFSKKWLNNNDQEISWDQDIQVTVGRKTGETKDTNFSLVYNITKSAVDSGTVEFTATGGTETTPKLVLTIVEENGKKYYNFKIDNLEYANEDGQKYTYYAEETNSQLEFYLAPSYSNTSAPNGATQAYDGGTIINKKEGGVELPSTGGPGTKLFYGMGIAFIVMAGLLLFIKRKSIRSIADLSERRW